jgi:hypothetical protein
LRPGAAHAGFRPTGLLKDRPREGDFVSELLAQYTSFHLPVSSFDFLFSFFRSNWDWKLDVESSKMESRNWNEAAARFDSCLRLSGFDFLFSIFRISIFELRFSTCEEEER